MNLIAVAVLAAAVAFPAFGAGKAVTSAEAEAFAADYIRAITKKDLQLASRMVDWDGVLERVTAGGGASDEYRDEFLTGARRGTEAFVQGVAMLVEDGGTVTLAGVRRMGGETHVVLRLLHSGSGLNYHDMPLARDASGVLRARDVYVYTTGENLSDTLRRAFLMGTGKSGLDWAFDFQQMMAKIRQGDGDGAIAVYGKLPETVRRDKAVLIAYVAATQLVDDEAVYTRAMNELRTAHPKDNGIELMSIDWHLLAGRPEEALKSIDRVDDAVGGDAYLDVLRANILLEQGEIAKAAGFAVRASEREPYLEDAWWVRVSVTLARKDFVETARVLRHIRDELEVEIADLTTIPGYEEFVKSPAYRQFLE